MKRLPALLLSLAVVGNAQAAIYTCKDANGKTFASDHLLPECMGQATRELSAAGVTVRSNAGPQTAEQARQAEIERKRSETADRVQREARRRDEALLASYKDADAIEAARTRSLRDSQAAIKTSEAALAALAREQKAIDQEVAAGRKVSPALRRRVDDNASATAAENKVLAKNRDEIDRVNARYDEIVERYKAISGPGR